MRFLFFSFHSNDLDNTHEQFHSTITGLSSINNEILVITSTGLRCGVRPYAQLSVGNSFQWKILDSDIYDDFNWQSHWQTSTRHQHTPETGLQTIRGGPVSGWKWWWRLCYRLSHHWILVFTKLHNKYNQKIIEHRNIENVEFIPFVRNTKPLMPKFFVFCRSLRQKKIYEINQTIDKHKPSHWMRSGENNQHMTK